MSSIPNAIIAAAQAQGVDPALALEVAIRESGANPNAPDGSSGEIGIFQIMPATGAGLGYSVAQLRDPAQNIEAGIKYLYQLLARFGDVGEALAAYNWGPTKFAQALANYGSDWFFHIPSSTQNYVTTILGNVQTQYSAVSAFAAAGASPGGGTSTLTIPSALLPATGGFSWRGAALVMGMILGVGLALEEI
jgi:soluble lytic murein transglycosylase-like protein